MGLRSRALEAWKGLAGGLDYIMEKKLESLKEKGSSPACAGKGCDACCFDPTSITKMEGKALKRAFRNMNKRDRLRAIAQLDRWWEVHKEEGTLLLDLGQPQEATFRALQTSWRRNTPCMFLFDGECSVYEYRPFSCRTHFSLEDDPNACAEKAERSVPIHLLDVRHELARAYAIAKHIFPKDQRQELHQQMRDLLKKEPR